MSGTCKKTGLTSEDAENWSDLHSLLTGKYELNEPTKDSLEKYNDSLSSIVSNNKSHNSDNKRIQGLINHLEKSIVSKFKGSKLIPFGSTNNGLSLKGSDLDLCFQQKDADSKKVIKRITGIMRGQGMEKVQAIAGAKIPIVKFVDPRSGINVDISINNSLALYNTKLLKAYSEIDSSVRNLTLCIKHWALHRNIGDSYSGTLSSYAWTNMAIAHLQLEGIVPNIQAGKDRTIVEIEETEYDITFDNNAEVKHYETTLSELISRFFFRYSKWDWENHVVSIRNGGYIDRKEKGWDNEKPFALDAIYSDSKMGLHHMPIEDPFNLEHDLSNTMRIEGELSIKNELIRAARMFSEGKSWDQICNTVEPDRLSHLEPDDLFHDLRSLKLEDVVSKKEKISTELSDVENLVNALEDEKAKCVQMAKAIRGLIDETADLRKEHKAVINNLKKLNSEIENTKKARDEINSNIIIPLHMIEEELGKVYTRLTEELNLQRVPSLEKEKYLFSWFIELQSMHLKAKEATSLHAKFIQLIKEQKENVSKLKTFEKQHDETTKKLLEEEPLLKEQKVSSNEIRAHDRRIQNIQKILRKRRAEIHKLRREQGRLDAWIRKQKQPRDAKKRRSNVRKKKNTNSSGPMTLGDISGLLSGFEDKKDEKKKKKNPTKKSSMKRLGNISAHRGNRSSFKPKD